MSKLCSTDDASASPDASENQLKTWSTDDVQEHHFRTGLYTHLHVKQEPRGNNAFVIKWTFSFSELGMHHTLRGRGFVKQKEGQIYVNGKPVESGEAARERVFGGRYRRYLAKLYRDLELTSGSPAPPAPPGSSHDPPQCMT